MLTNCLSLNFCVNVSLTRSAKQLVALLRAETPSAEAGSPERRGRLTRARRPDSNTLGSAAGKQQGNICMDENHPSCCESKANLMQKRDDLCEHQQRPATTNT